MMMNKLYDRTLASQDLNQMALPPPPRNLGLAAGEHPTAKIGQAPGHQPYTTPMYSPLQHHNPKRKGNDMNIKMIKADHNIARPGVVNDY
jgi:hypothetical protein